jgi:hypothetical protein
MGKGTTERSHSNLKIRKKHITFEMDAQNNNELNKKSNIVVLPAMVTSQ